MFVPDYVYQCPACGTPYPSAEAMRRCQLDDEAADRDARRR